MNNVVYICLSYNSKKEHLKNQNLFKSRTVSFMHKQSSATHICMYLILRKFCSKLFLNRIMLSRLRLDLITNFVYFMSSTFVMMQDWAVESLDDMYDPLGLIKHHLCAARVSGWGALFRSIQRQEIVIIRAQAQDGS